MVSLKVMGRKIDWSKVQREKRLITRGAETVDGRVIENVEITEGAKQQALHGPGHVSLKVDYFKARRKLFERSCRGLAGSQKLPDTSGLPRSLVLEVEAAGGVEKWVVAQNGAQERIMRIRHLMATRVKKGAR